MRLCIVGAGAWGSVVAHRASQLIGVDVVAVVDTNHTRAEQVAYAVGAGWYGNIRGAAGTAPTHAVVATPPGTNRLAQVRELIDAGVRRIRVEKPVALNATEAERILDACAAAGVTATVGHTPLNDEAVPVIADVLGSWDAVQMIATRIGTRTPEHRAGVVRDLAVHDLALARTLLGSLRVVKAAERDQGRSCRVELVGANCDVIIAAQYADRATRHTLFTRRGADDALLYDEAAGVVAHNGRVIWTRSVDPLGLELAAWQEGGGIPLGFGVDIVRLVDEVPACA